MNLKTIGWAEYIDYPEWGIDGVKAKIDTGARSSALHVENLEDLGDGRVEFDVVYSRRKPFKRKRVTAPVVKWARVRSSTGHFQKRCFVMARIRIGEEECEVEISLVSRDKMLFRMLLGRKALEHRFLVDVSRRNVLSSRRSKKKKIT
ncbi:ATP-dependent zinc protease family protein [Luteolibacter marinus]|uniref:ATP-dependent zinc protease family protein n=1 Tax=Luteolibacter marinus TaxID=2776705 RepID=UPI0018676009|nr:RimK/LysX family protein [Luteolibacter marinus]